MAHRGKQAVRASVWHRYIGKDKGSSSCYICGVNEITQLNFAACHVVAESKGGAYTVENLRPGCTLCNSGMNNENAHTFARRLGLKGQITLESEPVVTALTHQQLPEDTKACKLCQKLFQVSTLAKYDGEHCGKCFKQLYTQYLDIPDDKKDMTERNRIVDIISELTDEYANALFEEVILTTAAKRAAMKHHVLSTGKMDAKPGRSQEFIQKITQQSQR